MSKLILSGSSRCGTTVTRRILCSNPDIWITNELRTFFHEAGNIKMPTRPVLYAPTAKEYFEALVMKVKTGEGVDYHGFPTGFNFDTFVDDCMRNLHDDSLDGRLNAVCETIGGNRFKYIGDKGASHKVLLDMYEKGIEYKLIVIHRDGRDAAASGARHRRGLKPPWSNCCVENADHWAGNFEGLFSVLDKIDNRNYTVLRFEDYIENPDLNYKKMADLLEVDVDSFNKNIFKPDSSHMGYFPNHCPDWENTFTERSKTMLKRLNYI